MSLFASLLVVLPVLGVILERYGVAPMDTRGSFSEYQVAEKENLRINRERAGTDEVISGQFSYHNLYLR